nr:MAG TPA: hypothetical protein [Caudoviricetes sp.]
MSMLKNIVTLFKTGKNFLKLMMIMQLYIRSNLISL